MRSSVMYTVFVWWCLASWSSFRRAVTSRQPVMGSLEHQHRVARLPLMATPKSNRPKRDYV